VFRTKKLRSRQSILAGKMVSVMGGSTQGFHTGDIKDTHPLGGQSGAVWRAWWFSREDSMYLGLSGCGRGLLQFLPTSLQQEFPQRGTLVQM